MQIDNTLFLGSEEFTTLKDNKLQKANFSAKLRNELLPTSNLMFNRYVLSQVDDIIILLQKNQGKKLQLINAKNASSQ